MRIPVTACRSKSLARRRHLPSHANSFDDPLARQKLEAFAQWPLDDLNLPWSPMGERGYELIAAINPIGKDMASLRDLWSQSLQQWDGAVAVLNVGGMNVDRELISVHAMVLSSNLRNPKESLPAEITHCFFSETLRTILNLNLLVHEKRATMSRLLQFFLHKE